MNDISEQRPSFFEGEVLSASDLEQLVIYLRDQNARHLLGGHTWGIVAGLQLLEQTSPSGGVDVYLLPGYAIDGYGRAIVVVNPLRLNVDWFNGQPTGPVQVWIRYDEGQTNAVRPGFQVCCDGNDAYSRVAESYAIEVGNKSLAKQQSGISVAGETVDDARTALRVFNDAGPILCDASVPFQDLPLVDDTKSAWLIPLGDVGWQAGTPGQFTTLVDPADSTKVIYSRRLRRYIGVVAENVYAADGLIRMRRRTTEVAGLVDQKVVDAACELGELTDPSHDADFEDCVEGPTPTELVWIEGRLRVTDDTRILAPGRLEMRDKHGTSYFPKNVKGCTPTFLRRDDHTSGLDNNADLAVVIGKAENGNNRFLVQQADDPQQPAPCHAVTFNTHTTRFAVLDSGNVGIGTGNPDELLEIENAGPAYLHVRDTADASNLYAGAGKYGGVIGVPNTNDLRIRTRGTDPTTDPSDPKKDDNISVIVLGGGQVGIGTSDPDTQRTLTVEADGKASVLVRTHDQKHEGILMASPSGTLIAAHTSGDDLILSADGDETGKVFVKPSGRVGIGSSNPGHTLGIQDNVAAEIGLLKSGGAHMVLGADGTGTLLGSVSNDDLTLFTNNTSRVVVQAGGNVGIATTAPKERLDVRGNIVLGPTGQYYAAGGYQNWIILAGSIPGGGFAPGIGYSFNWGLTGECRVDFAYSFPSVPAVTVTLVGAPGWGGLPGYYIKEQDGSHFTVSMTSGSPYAFNFVAMLAR